MSEQEGKNENVTKATAKEDKKTSLAREICEQSVYSRIENGNYTGDIHFVMAVLGRLGISGSKAKCGWRYHTFRL